MGLLRVVVAVSGFKFLGVCTIYIIQHGAIATLVYICFATYFLREGEETGKKNFALLVNPMS